MSKNLVTVAQVVLGGLAVPLAISRCSTDDVKKMETIGASSAQLTTGPNYEIQHGPGPSTVSATSALSTQGVRHWVVAFNNFPVGANLDVMGWAYSVDMTGNSWNVNVFTPPTEEGGQWAISGPTADGAAFAGWLGDPSIARLGNSNSALVMVGLVASTNWGPSSTANFPSDVGMLVSQDGGQTWFATNPPASYRSPQYVTDATTGIAVEQPQVVTNPNYPYSTFVAWSSFTNIVNPLPPHNNVSPTPRGWLTSINTNPASGYEVGSSNWAVASPHWPGANYAKTILDVPQPDGIPYPKIAVNTVELPTCTGNVDHEMVYVAWESLVFPNRGDFILSPPLTVRWYGAAYDNSTDQWSDPVPLGSDLNYPAYIGNGTPPESGGFANSNSPVPFIVADTQTGVGTAAVVFNHSTPRGARIHAATFNVTPVCGGKPIVNLGTPSDSKDPCYGLNASGGTTVYYVPQGGGCGDAGGSGGGNAPDGGVVYTDQWGAQISYYNDGTDETLITWYDTANDLTLTNTHAEILAVLTSGSLAGGNLWSSPAPTTISNGLGTLPWGDTAVTWGHYQALAIDTTTVPPRFLSAWGGDCRNGGPPGDGVFSSIITK